MKSTRRSRNSLYSDGIVAACFTVNSRRGYCRDSLSITAGTNPTFSASWVPSSHFTCRRVNQRLYLSHALREVVKDRGGPFEQGAAIERRLDTVRRAIKKRYSERVFHFGNRFRHSRLGQRKLCSGLSHAADLRHGHQDAELAQLQAPHHALFQGEPPTHE